MKYFFLILFAVALVLPPIAFAQIETGTAGTGIETGTAGTGIETGTPAANHYDGQPFQNEVVLLDPLKGEINSIPAFFRAIIQILLVFAIPFVVFFIVWAGFLYVTARGNPEKIAKAHNALLYAIIGGLLILGSDLLLTVITNTIDQVRN